MSVCSAEEMTRRFNQAETTAQIIRKQHHSKLRGNGALEQN